MNWPHRNDCGPPPDIPMVAMDFCFANTESDDDVLTILAMKEKPFQSVGATVLPVESASEFAVATITGYLDFWGHQEVMIKCDQELKKDDDQDGRLLSAVRREAIRATAWRKMHTTTWKGCCEPCGRI